MEITGADIKAWRESHGISRAGWAKRLGVHWMTIYRWESGLSHPSPMAVRLLHKLMKDNDGDKNYE